jgi:hypothetical protein
MKQPKRLYSKQYDSYCTWNGVAYENDGKVPGAYFYGLEKAKNNGFEPIVMKTFILVGKLAVKHFENNDWKVLERTILEDYNGDLIAWNKETDNVSELLEQLRGWDNFIELSEQDLKDIEANTKIEIDW